MKTFRFFLLLSLSLLPVQSVLAAVPFSYSARQVTTIHSGGKTSITQSRVFVSGQKIREELGVENGQAKSVMIVLMDENKAWSLNPARKIAFSIPLKVSSSQRMLSGDGKGLPAPSGTEMVDGVLCDRIDLVENGKPAGTEWRNHKTGYPVMFRSVDGRITTRLSDFVAGPQPAALFAVPAGYRILNLSGMGGVMGNALHKMMPSVP
ncbi:MAG: hypothetical protein ACYCRD_10175 [Leptospirillum sp.]